MFSRPPPRGPTPESRGRRREAAESLCRLSRTGTSIQRHPEMETGRISRRKCIRIDSNKYVGQTSRSDGAPAIFRRGEEPPRNDENASAGHLRTMRPSALSDALFAEKTLLPCNNIRNAAHTGKAFSFAFFPVHSCTQSRHAVRKKAEKKRATPGFVERPELKPIIRREHATDTIQPSGQL